MKWFVLCVNNWRYFGLLLGYEVLGRAPWLCASAGRYKPSVVLFAISLALRLLAASLGQELAAAITHASFRYKKSFVLTRNPARE